MRTAPVLTGQSRHGRAIARYDARGSRVQISLDVGADSTLEQVIKRPHAYDSQGRVTLETWLGDGGMNQARYPYHECNE